MDDQQSFGMERKLSSHRNFIKANNKLSQQFAKFCDLEFSDLAYSNDPGMSKEDLRTLSIMEQSVTLKEGHNEIVLPWRNTPPYLLNNQPLVEHRLKLVQR